MMYLLVRRSNTHDVGAAVTMWKNKSEFNKLCGVCKYINAKEKRELFLDIIRRGEETAKKMIEDKVKDLLNAPPPVLNVRDYIAAYMGEAAISMDFFHCLSSLFNMLRNVSYYEGVVIDVDSSEHVLTKHVINDTSEMWLVPVGIGL